MVNEFAAYFDDSGHPNDQTAVVVAGFLAKARQWLVLEKEWLEALAAEGVSLFHAVDLHAGEGEFKGWDTARRAAFLDKLISIILDNTKTHFSDAVIMEDYKKVNAVYALEQCLGAPYAMAGRTIASKLNKWKAKRPTSKLLVIFEDGSKHKGDFIDAMERDQLPRPDFKKKSDLVLLQTADLLAWEVFQAIKVKDYDKCRKTFRRILDKQGGSGDGVWDGKALKRACKKLPVPLHSQLAPGCYIAFESSPKKRRRKTIK